MRIGSDILSLQAQRNLERTSKAFARALQRLASGKRINSARDDAAGLAIATGLDAQVRSLRQGVRNINDALSLLDVADGAIATQVDLVQRMRELAIESSSGTLDSEQRGYLEKEFSRLYEEFNRIVDQTAFSGEPLLNGQTESLQVQVGGSREENIQIDFADTRASKIFVQDRGSGNFKQSSNFSTLPYQSGLRAADLNNDGFDDLAFSGDTGNPFYHFSLRVAMSNGDGSFAYRNEAGISGGGAFGSLNFADVNEDGNLDMLIQAGAFGTKTEVRLGNGDGTFAFSSTIASTDGGNMLGDFDNDGHLDMLTFSGGPNLSLHLGNGDGSFAAPTTFASGVTNVLDLQLNDFNGDGINDLLVVDQYAASPAKMRIGNGDGTFQAGYNLNVGITNRHLQVADFNKDGILDLAAFSSSNVRIALGTGVGTFNMTGTLTTATPTRDVEVSDINSDGDLDLVVREDQNLTTYFNDGNGGFSATSKRSQPLAGSDSIYPQDNLVVGHFNNDEFEDVAVLENAKLSGLMGIGETVDVSSELSVATQESAQNSLSIFDTALHLLSLQRANLGAARSRLETSSSVDLVSIENLSEAHSQIMDTDYAEETAELMKQQILQQAGVSVMAQAQLQMKLVLDLLK